VKEDGTKTLLIRYTRMWGVFVLGIGGWVGGGDGGRDLVVPTVGTMTWGYYEWIISSFLCTRV